MNKKQFRQTLRRNMPEPEKRLWRCLRAKQLGVKFRRQHSIGRYVVDFYCPEKKLVIEVDGDSHFTPEAIAYDKERTRYIQSVGIDVLRVTNAQVMQELDAVLNQIMTKCV